MENPFTDDSKVIGAAVCIGEQWYYIDRVGDVPGTYVCVKTPYGKEEEIFTFADFDEFI